MSTLQGLRQSRPCMGSLLDITVAEPMNRRNVEATEAAFAEAGRIDRMLSIFRPDSEVCRINREASAGPVSASGELLGLIDQALAFSDVTEGAVDVTVAPLIRLWNDVRQHATPWPRPPTAEIRTRLASVGARYVQVDHQSGTVTYEAPDTALEFGALGKGYAVDRAVVVLGAHGVRSAVVGFGSSMYALGSPPGQRGWPIGIRDPRDAGRVIDTVTLRDAALATSGDDQQGAHVIDPRTGYPVTSAASASVIARTALEADALSAALLVLGRRGLTVLEERTGAEGLLVEAGARGPVTTGTTGYPRYRARPTGHELLPRRRALAALVAGALSLLLGPRLGHAIVYRTAAEAFRSLVPQAKTVREEQLTLSPEQLRHVEQRVGSRVRQARYRVVVGGEVAGTTEAYGVVLDVIGKEQPITFLVVVDPKGSIRGVDVLAYRESEGSEIRSGRFMRQFVGKTLDAPLRLGRDVEAISGATLSSRSTAFAVKKALALFEAVYGMSAPGNTGESLR